MEFIIQINCLISSSVYALLFFKLAWQTFFVNAFHYLSDNFVCNLHDSVLLTTVIIKWFKTLKQIIREKHHYVKTNFIFNLNGVILNYSITVEFSIHGWL